MNTFDFVFSLDMWGKKSVLQILKHTGDVYLDGASNYFDVSIDLLCGRKEY